MAEHRNTSPKRTALIPHIGVGPSEGLSLPLPHHSKDDGRRWLSCPHNFFLFPCMMRALKVSSGRFPWPGYSGCSINGRQITSRCLKTTENFPQYSTGLCPRVFLSSHPLVAFRTLFLLVLPRILLKDIQTLLLVALPLWKSELQFFPDPVLHCFSPVHGVAV